MGTPMKWTSSKHTLWSGQGRSHTLEGEHSCPLMGLHTAGGSKDTQCPANACEVRNVLFDDADFNRENRK